MLRTIEIQVPAEATEHVADQVTEQVAGRVSEEDVIEWVRSEKANT